MPKAGTHLLIRLLTLLGFRQSGGGFDIGPSEGLEHISEKHVEEARDKLMRFRPGFCVLSHLYFYPEVIQIIDELRIRAITIIRDPRDVCVSDAFYVAGQPGHRLHRYYSEMSKDERLMASIVGMGSDQLGGAPPSLDIGSHYRNYLGWATYDNGLVVRFEDLVGHRGGGDDQIQRETVTQLVEHLGLGFPTNRLPDVCAQAYWPKAKTFRKGQIGNWRDHFGPEHLAAFERVMGGVMEQLGYEM
jgi:hypothetical protein